MNELHVWKASVAEYAPHERALGSLLEAGELDRGARFYFDSDRVRHLVSHGVLRALAGHYLDRPPAALRFGQGAYGKPHLAGDDAGGLVFNLSHSGDVVLIALARTGRVGVDVECWTQRRDAHGIDRIAESVFSSAERAALRALAPVDRRAASFMVWSRKEAYIKATGLGVSHGLGHFDVSADIGEARLLADRRGAVDGADWALYDLALGHGYSGALAIDDRNRTLVQLNAVATLLVHDCDAPVDRHADRPSGTCRPDGP